jgi:hypothetical protein
MPLPENPEARSGRLGGHLASPLIEVQQSEASHRSVLLLLNWSSLGVSAGSTR